MKSLQALLTTSRPFKHSNSPYILCGSGLEGLPEMHRHAVGHIVTMARKNIEAGKPLTPQVVFETEGDGMFCFTPGKRWIPLDNYPEGVTFWCETRASTDRYDKPCVSVLVWGLITLAGETKVADCQIRLKEFDLDGQLTLDMPDFY